MQQDVPNYCYSFVVGYIMTEPLSRYNVTSIVRMIDESELERVSKEAIEVLI